MKCVENQTSHPRTHGFTDTCHWNQFWSSGSIQDDVFLFGISLSSLSSFDFLESRSTLRDIDYNGWGKKNASYNQATVNSDTFLIIYLPLKADPHVAVRWHCLCAKGSMTWLDFLHRNHLKEPDGNLEQPVTSKLGIFGVYSVILIFKHKHLYWFSSLYYFKNQITKNISVKPCGLSWGPALIHSDMTQYCNFLSSSFPRVMKNGFLLAESIIQSWPLSTLSGRQLSVKHGLGLEPPGHFMSDGQDKPPVSFWLNKDTDCISLCSAVESHQHRRRWTVENNLLHSCSCHVGLASTWTVIYFGL